MASGQVEMPFSESSNSNEKPYSEELKPIITQWEKEQDSMKVQCRIVDVHQWQFDRLINVEDYDETVVYQSTNGLMFIGGLDISFVKGDDVNACAAYVIVHLPSLKVVYEDLSMVKLDAPYVAGFLAFREASFLIQKVKHQQKIRPNLTPQAIIVDGNGILHPKEFGLACHVGVSLDLPTLGASKTLFHVDGIEKDDKHQNRIKSELLKGGDTFPLIGQSGKTFGMALRTCDSASNPIYVSPGHLITLETSVWLVQQCCQYRIPEPTRQADIKSRQYLRDNWPPKDDSSQINNNK